MSNPGHDLSAIRYTGGQDHRGDRIAIVVAKWNARVTDALHEGAKTTLQAAGVPAAHIHSFHVPGTFELPSAAEMVLTQAAGRIDAVICIGCVVQGETRHFDFICEAAAQGIKDVAIQFNRPVIFGVLTPNNDQQALDRAGGRLGNKGEEAAVAALEMIDVQREIRKALQ